MKKTIFITALAAISMVGCEKKTECPVCTTVIEQREGPKVTTVSSRDTMICDETGRGRYYADHNRTEEYVYIIQLGSGSTSSATGYRYHKTNCK